MLKWSNGVHFVFQIFQKRQAELTELSKPLECTLFPTSIWDETLYQVCFILDLMFNNMNIGDVLNSQKFTGTFQGHWFGVWCFRSWPFWTSQFHNITTLLYLVSGLFPKLLKFMKLSLMWCFVRFDIICTILKTRKTSKEECYF